MTEGSELFNTATKAAGVLFKIARETGMMITIKPENDEGEPVGLILAVHDKDNPAAIKDLIKAIELWEERWGYGLDADEDEEAIANG